MVGVAEQLGRERPGLEGNDEPARVGGVRYTIKDGIVYDAQELLGDVRRIVSEARAEKGQDGGPERLPYTPVN